MLSFHPNKLKSLHQLRNKKQLEQNNGGKRLNFISDCKNAHNLHFNKQITSYKTFNSKYPQSNKINNKLNVCTQINDENSSYAANRQNEQNFINQNCKIMPQDKSSNIQNGYKREDEGKKMFQDSLKQNGRPLIINMKKKIKKLQYQTHLNFTKQQSFRRQKIKFHKRSSLNHHLPLKYANQHNLKLQKDISLTYSPLQGQNNLLTLNNSIQLQNEIIKKQDSSVMKNDFIEFYVYNDREVFSGHRYEQFRCNIVPQRMDNDNQTDDQQVQVFLKKVTKDFLLNMEINKNKFSSQQVNQPFIHNQFDKKDQIYLNSLDQNQN